MHLPEPHLGMGTWGMGGKFERDESTAETSIEALRYGLSLGLTIIDVAEIYGAGLTEEIVSRAIHGYPRENVCIISKVWKTNLRHDDVLRAAEGSLKRLNTPYIDLYLVHWPSEDVPLSETMRAMERLVNDKMVRAIGVSNFSAELIDAASRDLTHTTLAADQIEYNLITRDAERSTIPYCRTHDIDIIAYRPLARGSLTRAHSARVDGLAAKYGKTPNQIMLNWILSQNMVAIPKASNPGHIKENAGALGWRLADEDVESLRAIEK